MKRPALVCLYWDRHLTALIHYLASRPSVVIVPSMCTAIVQLKELIAQVGGEVVVLDSFLDASAVEAVKSRAAQLAETLPNLLSSNDWQAFANRHSLDVTAFAGVVGEQLLVRLEEQLVLVEALERASDHYRIELLAVSEDLTRLPRTAVQWAKVRAIPSLHVAHGLPLATPYTVHNQLSADIYAIYGKRAAEACMDAGMPGERLRITGNPGWDGYAKALPKRAEIQAGMQEKYSLGKRPTVVFATTWVAWLSAFDHADRFDNGVRAFLRAVRVLRSSGKVWNFVIKDRDPNRDQGHAWVKRIAREEGVDDDAYLYVTDEAMSWVMCADALVASDSNMLVEAMHVGVPAVNLLNEHGLLMGPSFEADCGLLEIADQDLAEVLQRLIEDPQLRADLAWAMKKRLPDYNAGHDGSAALKVAAVMLDLAQQTAPANFVEGESFNDGKSAGSASHYVWQSLGETAGARESAEVYLDVPRKEVVGLFIKPPRRVLEIGCATGATALHLKSVYPDAWVAGIELSEAAVETARARMDVVINAKFEEADLEAHGISAGSIDAVIVADVLEHMYDPWGVLVRLKPYLSPDAQVIASIPNARNLWLMNELANGRFPYAPIGLLDITHIRFFTRLEIEKMFHETGYAIEAWFRTPDPRLMHLVWQPEMTAIETEKLALKNVGPEEFEDLKSLQFVVRAHPLSTDSLPTVPPARWVGAAPRVAVYSIDHPEAACAQIRYFRVFRELAGACDLIWAVREVGGHAVWDETAIAKADVIVLSRLFPGEESQRLIDAAFTSGKPVIYEADDLLIDLPADNLHAQEYAPRVPYIEATIRRAHAVVASTPILAERLKQLNQNVQVMPNLIDLLLFQQDVPDNGRMVRIGVVGTSGRGSDFALIDAALRGISAEYGKRVRLVFVGTQPSDWQGHSNAEFVPFTGDYGAYAARMKGLNLDIGLAPLADNPFNDCKSPIKWLEFSSLGMAGVFSNVPAYASLLRQGETGLLVDNTTEKWIAAIKLLIDYPEFRLKIAHAAKLAVLRDHSIARKAHRLAELFRRHAAAGMAASGQIDVPAETEDRPDIDYYTLWQLGHGYQERDARWMAERMADWHGPARFHIAAICLAGGEALLAHNIKSLNHQFYKGWRLTIVAESPAPEEFSDLSQIAWVSASRDELLPTLNRVLMDSEQDWVGMVEAGDRLAPHATFAVADALQRHPAWRLFYSDEDSLLDSGERRQPFFKTEFNLDMLRAAPFGIGGIVLMARADFARVGGFRAAAEGVETWDLVLRASEGLHDDEIGHIADVLYHRHEAGGHCSRASEEVAAAARTCLAEHLERLGLEADIEDSVLLPGSFRIRYQVRGEPLVSVIIPTKNRVDLLKNCLTSLIERTAYSRAEILVVDNGSDDPATLAFLQELRNMGADSLRVLEHPGEFNFSAMNNHAAREARGEYLLLLNNDTEILHGDWLEEMLGYAQRADVGAVGARLLYPDGSIQHAGIILGLGGIASNHPWQKAAGDDPGYFGRLMLAQDFSALTGACLLTRKAVYDAAGGLDEQAFSVNFNDVDYCLRLREQGLKVVWTPFATLRHEESVSQVDATVEQATMADKQGRLFDEVDAITGKWPRWFANDPAYNRNLSLILPFQPEPTPALCWDPEWRPRPRVLSIHADAMGCGEYRIIAPMRALNTAGKVMGWDAAGYFHPREYARVDPDSIVFQRQVNWAQIECIEKIARQYPEIFRVFELDDLITNIPIMSSVKADFVSQKDITKRFRKAVGLCHRFVVSTDYLAEAFARYNDELVVVPNYLEQARWGGLTPRRRGGEKARVGWAGSATHAGDLRLIVDVVKATADEVDWVFFGMCPDAIRPLVKEYHEPVRLVDYAAKLASLDLDLAIAPLEDIPFNHGKSHLRILEYGMMGYPVVCSNITPYRGDYPVTRVENKFKAWVEAIRSHVADRDALAVMGDDLRDHVLKHWVLEDHLDVWLKAWLPS